MVEKLKGLENDLHLKGNQFQNQKKSITNIETDLNSKISQLEIIQNHNISLKSKIQDLQK